MKFSRRLSQAFTAMFFLCISDAAFSAPSGKTDLVQAWQKYFQSFKSLEVKSTSTKLMWDRKKLANDNTRHNLILQGVKYRYESTPPKFIKDFSFMIHAYNGKIYQVLDGTEKPVLYRSNSLGGLNPYPTTAFLPVNLFVFAFRRSDVQSLVTLQSNQVWRNLEKRIESIKPINGSLLVSVRGVLGGDKYEVLVDEDTYFPSQVKHIFLFKDKPAYTLYEAKKTKTVKGQGSTVLVPTVLEWNGYANGSHHSSGVTKIDENTLFVNRSIKNEIFTLPVTQSTVLREEGEQTRLR